MKNPFYPIVKGIGRWKDVETIPDTYRDYYVTACELVTPKNVYYPEQISLIAEDPHFENSENCYLVTAVQAAKNKKGDIKHLTERKFIFNEDDAKTLGLIDDNGKIVDPMPKIMMLKTLTLGQYLIPFWTIYPRAQEIEARKASITEIADIEAALKEEVPVRRNLVPWFNEKQSPKP